MASERTERIMQSPWTRFGSVLAFGALVYGVLANTSQPLTASEEGARFIASGTPVSDYPLPGESAYTTGSCIINYLPGIDIAPHLTKDGPSASNPDVFSLDSHSKSNYFILAALFHTANSQEPKGYNALLQLNGVIVTTNGNSVTVKDYKMTNFPPEYSTTELKFQNGEVYTKHNGVMYYAIERQADHYLIADACDQSFMSASLSELNRENQADKQHPNA